MSALSPFAVEFVQGKAYAGKITKSDQNERMTDALSENFARVNLDALKPPRPKVGQAYDVSLESMLIETALSRLPLPSTVSKPEAYANRGQQKTRKKKYIRPSDSHKKLSKLKRSVIDFRGQQEQAPEEKVVAESCEEIAERKSCVLSDNCEPNVKARSEDLTKSGSESSLKVDQRPRLKAKSAESDNTLNDEPSDSQSIAESSSEAPTALQPSTNPSKQPLKQISTIDRLKENLQGDALKEVETLATELITGLKLFQNRLYNKDEVKARMRQRMYYGLKESMKLMQSQKVKMIIMARDLEPGPGGLDELIDNLLSKAKIYRVPVVLALTRSKLRRLSQKPSKVACIAITDPSGRDDQFEQIAKIVKPLGILDNLDKATATAIAQERYRKAQQDLETWTSTTRRGRFEFAVDQLFSK